MHEDSSSKSSPTMLTSAHALKSEFLMPCWFLMVPFSPGAESAAWTKPCTVQQPLQKRDWIILLIKPSHNWQSAMVFLAWFSTTNAQDIPLLALTFRGRLLSCWGFLQNSSCCQNYQEHRKPLHDACLVLLLKTRISSCNKLVFCERVVFMYMFEVLPITWHLWCGIHLITGMFHRDISYVHVQAQALKANNKVVKSTQDVWNQYSWLGINFTAEVHGGVQMQLRIFYICHDVLLCNFCVGVGCRSRTGDISGPECRIWCEFLGAWWRLQCMHAWCGTLR